MAAITDDTAARLFPFGSAVPSLLLPLRFAALWASARDDGGFCKLGAGGGDPEEVRRGAEVTAFLLYGILPRRRMRIVWFLVCAESRADEAKAWSWRLVWLWLLVGAAARQGQPQSTHTALNAQVEE